MRRPRRRIRAVFQHLRQNLFVVQARTRSHRLLHLQLQVQHQFHLQLHQLIQRRKQVHNNLHIRHASLQEVLNNHIQHLHQHLNAVTQLHLQRQEIMQEPPILRGSENHCRDDGKKSSKKIGDLILISNSMNMPT